MIEALNSLLGEVLITIILLFIVFVAACISWLAAERIYQWFIKNTKYTLKLSIEEKDDSEW